MEIASSRRSATAASTSELLEGLADARARTLALVSVLDAQTLERVLSKLLSPLVWDLGHIAAFEDLWICNRYGGRELLHDELADVYDAFETPRANRGDLPFLRTGAAFEYLEEVRTRSLDVIAEQGVGDGVTVELVIRHELQHQETMLQAIQLARLDYPRPSGDPDVGRESAVGLELVAVPGGHCEVGAPATGFAYDNERPRHVHGELAEFKIGRAAITNGEFRAWIDAGGYTDRRYWSAAGLLWLESESTGKPLYWNDDLSEEWRLGRYEPLNPCRPVIHVSYYEAEAFARAHGLRLPTEFEWERAAGFDPADGSLRAKPWGSSAAGTAAANLGDLAGGTLIPSTETASPCGVLGMLGDTWEWTSSNFDGYPGFEANPYREYSEVFFGSDYWVLRGGSWAATPRVVSTSFRNWDYPQRRQIFTGFRVAVDA